METVTESYAHVLLFACPKCGIPLASACASPWKNLEITDAHYFNPHCPCGWTGGSERRRGREALGRSLEDSGQIRAGRGGSCDKN
jgi:hypothetical protein